MIRCHNHPCRAPGHVVGKFECPFCSKCFHALTPLKQSEVLSIQHFSVLELGSRARAVGIINESRRYLASKQQRKTA